MKRVIRKWEVLLLMVTLCVSTIDISTYATESKTTVEMEAAEDMTATTETSIQEGKNIAEKSTEEESIEEESTEEESTEEESTEEESTEEEGAEEESTEEEGAEEESIEEESTEENIKNESVLKMLYKNEICIIECEITSQWNMGYNMNIILTNIGETTIEDWSFELLTSDTINNLWNALYEKTDNGYRLKAYDWNKSIAPNASITIGFTATCNENSIATPSINNENASIQVEGDNSISVANSSTVYTTETYEVKYEITNSWQSASNVKVKITNLSDEVIHNWGLRFISSDIFENIYNGVEKGEGDVHLIKNATWNQDIPVKGTVEFGFIQRYDSEIEIPLEFELVYTEKIVEDSNYCIDIVEQTKWDENATIQLVIENLSDEALEDWSLSFSNNFEIIDIWNAEIINKGSNFYTLRNASYAQNILPKESYFIGMNVKCLEEQLNISNCILKEVEASVEEKQSENLIYETYFDTYTIATKENVSCKVWVKTSGEEGTELKVYKNVDGKWVYVTDLYDSGEMSQHGDEIENDGIYTNTMTLYEENASVLQYKLSLMCGGIEKESVIEEIEVVEAISQEEFKEYYSNTEYILSNVKSYINNDSYVYGDTVEKVSSYILENCNKGDILDVECINGSVVKVIFTNGQKFYIQFSDKSNKETMIRGGGVGLLSDSVGVIEVATTKARNILYWAPFDTVWGDSDETESIKSIVDESAYSEDFDMITDASANVSSLKNIENYGLVIFATHGIGGEWIVTGEKVTSSSKYLKEFATGQMSIYYDYDPSSNSYSSYYMVNDKWFMANIKNSLPDSIIINNSCESSKTDKLWNSFKNLGANTYYGNNGAVTNSYAKQKCSMLVSKLILDREITGDACESSLDTYYNSGASFIVRGQGNLALSNCVSNACFENGLRYWTIQGDCRALNKLGNIKPTQGNYMGMISTGIGYTMKGGAITQRIDVPENAKYMYFDWNFISAEFLEYINSAFDDPFEITVKCLDDDGNKEIIFRKSVNSLAKDFGASKTNAGELICISPTVQLNGYNDIWMTDWQSEKIDISKYAGKTLTLTFGVTNATDTAYPSAILLDNIHLDNEYGSSDEYIEVDEPDNISANSTGKSYILYVNEFAQQAEAIREQIKYENGYVDISQVKMNKISTEVEFVEAWNAMSPGNGNTKIDNVVIVMHGNYYAIIIDSAVNDNSTGYIEGKTPQNLTVNLTGKVGSDYDATYIGNLSPKKIKTLNLYSCNAGLLDAINVSLQKSMSALTGHFGEEYQVDGNVAQAFLSLNTIDKIIAYDGSVGFENNLPRISYEEEHYFGYLNELVDYRKVIPYRFNAGMNYFSYKYVVKNGLKAFEYGVMPNGEVTYLDNNDAWYNYFQLESKITDGIIPVSYNVNVKHTAKIDLNSNKQEIVN